MDSYRRLDASLDYLSTTMAFFPSLDALVMEDELFNEKLAYLYEKGQFLELF